MAQGLLYLFLEGTNMRRKKQGQAIVEMAILFPIFLMVVIGGLVDFGFAFYNAITLQQLANDAAQFGAEGNGTTGITSAGEITTYINDKKPSWWNSGLTVTYNPAFALPTGGDKAAVVTLEFISPLYTPFYQTLSNGLLGATGITLRTQAAYKIPQIVSSH
jgi:Flp pilus assembly protein TadG